MTELKSDESQVAGQAQRVPALLKSQHAIAHATIQVTRAATGKVEEYQLTFMPLPADDQPQEAK
ncbi:MAG: hypothetical protein JSR30_13195 [Proteobacteria bacterium]|nr:hypothetical protein [Pseudomonadota bacterium]